MRSLPTFTPYPASLQRQVAERQTVYTWGSSSHAARGLHRTTRSLISLVRERPYVCTRTLASLSIRQTSIAGDRSLRHLTDTHYVHCIPHANTDLYTHLREVRSVRSCICRPCCPWSWVGVAVKISVDVRVVG